MSENLNNIQKTYEAIAGKSREKNDSSAIFETENARKYHLEHLDSKDVQSSIDWLEKDGSAVAEAVIMKETLKKYLAEKQGTVVDAQKGVATLTAQQQVGVLKQQTGPSLPEQQKVVEGISKMIEALSKPEGLKEALNLYKTEKEKKTPEGRMGDLRTIMTFALSSKKMQLDISGGEMSLADDKDVIDQETTKLLLETTSKNEIVEVLAFLVTKEYPNTKGDPTKIKDAICSARGIVLTGNISTDRQLIDSTTGLTGIEKTWLRNYVINNSSVVLPEVKQKEIAQEAAKTAKEQAKNQVELAKATKVEWSAADFEDPGKAFGKLLANGGPMLVLGGGLWLLLSCFGMKTSGEGHFFMKMLAGVAGVGALKGTGLWDYGFNAATGKPGTTGARHAEVVANAVGWSWDKVTQVFNGAVAGSTERLERFKIWYDYSNFEAQGIGGPDGKTYGKYSVQDLNFHSLRTKLQSNSINFNHKTKNEPMKAEDRTKLLAKTNDLYNDGITKMVREGNSNPTQAMLDATKDMTITQMIMWTTDVPKTSTPTPAQQVTPAARVAPGVTTAQAPAANIPQIPAGQVQTLKPSDELV